MQEDLWNRGIGGRVVLMQNYNYHEAHVLRILSVTFFSLSIIAAILTLYGFYKMRRSFRHDLVMVLITSGSFKAFWCWIYAIVFLKQGHIDSSSAFCQVSGFFLALGTEASDLAVLMIAVHSTLYVFHPPTSLGEGGLYPYRRVVFAIWSAIPVLLALLAFTNPSHAYYAGAVSCYLPVRPFWYRLALAWIPRYTIFTAIIILDASIYFYARYKFGNFSDTIRASHRTTRKKPRRKSAKPRETGNIPLKSSGRHSAPLTPPLAYNELLPDTRRTSWDTTIESTESPSNILYATTVQTLTNHSSPPRILQKPTVAPRESSDLELRPNGLLAAAIEVPSSTSPSSTTRSWTSFASRFRSQKSTGYSSRSFLRQPRLASSPITPSTPLSQNELVNGEGYNLVHLPMLEARAKTRQQLRFLFIYPLAYLCAWIVPFASHVLQYDDKYVLDPPYVLNAIAVVILGSQCFLDCLIFTWREKPWRRPLQNRTTWAQHWADCKDWQRGRKNSRSATRRSGKSRVAMLVDAKLAYRRRDVEISEATFNSANRAKRVEISWWDEPEEEYERADPLTESSVSRLAMRDALVNKEASKPGEETGDNGKGLGTWNEQM